MFNSLRKTAGAVLVSAAVMAGAAQADQIRVGGKNFTEQLLMTEITVQYLAAKGYDTKKLEGMGTAVVRSAMENGQVDIYWEYTGTSLITFNKIEESLSPEETYETVRDLDAKVGITWLNPSEANSTYAIAVRASDDKGLTTVSDMAAAYNGGNDLSFGVNAEFPKRPDGLPGLQDAYGFKAGRGNLVPMQTGLIYSALKEEKLDIGLVFALDGRIAAFDFKVLEDDQGFFPNYALTPNIRTEVLEANPELGELLNGLSAIYTDEIVRDLCARVDVDKMTVEDAAAAFLAEQGLV
ncbi:glycine betaine ABC transporter substrate-binding protein [Tropicimonas sediminicola]|uniref:Osmoprotectant transport system substrate-binding protein n=1 Tax=Tropicimonas sediminicola TaxID=1031541 RepID=A0A239D759_9RHOB|nr:glycine betaine ABC transporter substrate-binding protein [Tropicimonas sediminicola]SNS27704.1 osmoprotectant transport system substrate-binding protein [Tropicimonas sediminicola]